MKRLALVLALLCIPALALAQSDGRKVAIFTFNGGSSDYGQKSTGYPLTSSNYYGSTVAMEAVKRILERTGTPYDEILVKDSTNAWQKQIVRGTGSSRAAGEADSTWFRRNGYMGAIFIMFNGYYTYEPIHFFQSGTKRGKQVASPIDGTWGIPVIVFTDGPRSDITGGYRCGVLNATASTTAGDSLKWVRAAYLDNGDSLSWYNVYHVVRDTSGAMEDSVTVLVAAGDTCNATSSKMRAWKWKNNAYYYQMSYNGQSFMPILLGISKMFSVAGYSPRRKLNLHLTNDHIFQTVNHYTAAADSLLAYYRTNQWRFRGGVNYSSLEAHPDTLVKQQWYNNRDLFVAYPHSHKLLGLIGASWNLEAADLDSALFRARFNDAMRAVYDTAWVAGQPLVTRPSGYETTIEFPMDQMKYPLIKTLAEAGITNIRAASLDSCGYGQPNLSSRGQVTMEPTGSHALGSIFRNSAHPWMDPSTSKVVWIHGALSWPGSADTAWTMPSALWGSRSFKESFETRFLDYASVCIVEDMDLYYHSEDNLKGQWLGMANMYRKLTYLMGRISNICTVQPRYLNKIPRRHNVAVSHTGQSAWR